MRGRKSPTQTKAVEAKRRGAQPAKSALSQAEKSRKENTAARSSTQRDARQKNIHDQADWKSLNDKAVKNRGLVKKQVEELKKEPLRCKERPKDNKPKKGGGGGSKEFIPWC